MIDTAVMLPDIAATMLHRILPLLAALAAPQPALAQGEPFRILNASAAPARELYVVRSGTDAWGGNLLNRGPLAAGAQFALRAPTGAGCVFDIRIVLQTGQEDTRREVDVCAERTVPMAGAFRTPPPRPGAMPQVGGGDRLIPTIPVTPR